MNIYLSAQLASAIEVARVTSDDKASIYYRAWWMTPSNLVSKSTLKRYRDEYDVALVLYGDLRAVAAAWDEHQDGCDSRYMRCERLLAIEAEAKRLLGVKEA